MLPQGPNGLAEITVPLFVELANPSEVGFAAPDAAPCPLAFLGVGTIASDANEITALAKPQGATIRKLKLMRGDFLFDERLGAQAHHGRRRLAGGAFG